MRKIQQGFTLIELMIVVAIIGILAAVAIPNYQQYTKKAKFTELVNLTGALKTGVEVCVQNASCYDATNNAVTGVSMGVGDVPQAPISQYGTISASASGVLTSTGTAGGLTETFIMSPSVSNGQVIWGKSGSCTNASGGAIC